MAGFKDSLQRLRRFLRDPDGDVHTDAQLLRYWQQAEREIAQKTGWLERADTLPYPSRFTWAFLQAWEPAFLEGDVYRALTPWEPGRKSIAYPWEASYWHESGGPADDGTRFMQPWESYHTTPADPVPVLLHRLHSRMKFAAYDRKALNGTTERELAKNDPFWRTRQGVGTSYYPLDETQRLLAIYPRPPMVLAEADPFSEVEGEAGAAIWLEVEDDALFISAEDGTPLEAE